MRLIFISLMLLFSTQAFAQLDSLIFPSYYYFDINDLPKQDEPKSIYYEEVFRNNFRTSKLHVHLQDRSNHSFSSGFDYVLPTLKHSKLEIDLSLDQQLNFNNGFDKTSFSIILRRKKY